VEMRKKLLKGRVLIYSISMNMKISQNIEHIYKLMVNSYVSPILKE